MPPDPAPIDFQTDVRPLLRAHCMTCHGLEQKQADLDLRTLPLLLRGGAQGPAILPGSAAKSLLFKKVAARSMPPKSELPLSARQIETLRRWIETAVTPPPTAPPDVTAIDATDRTHWAFQPPQHTLPPPLRDPRNARVPIDRFLLARLEAAELSYTAHADRPALIRRLTLDLTGLPPTPAATRDFVLDPSPSAYEHLVDRLLASPHFGQKWGRHWLDASGYVDTIGDDTDATIAKIATGKWRYREYVIDAYNNDTPYDRFVREQVAGDEMSNWREAEQLTTGMREQLIATTFLRSAADETLQTELNTADMRHEVLARTMEVTIHNLLALTIQCARCHDHKYDPLPQQDYYQLLACFTPAFNPQAWLQPAERELPDIAPKKKARLDTHNANVKRQIDEHNKQIGGIQTPHRNRIADAKLRTLPAVIRDDVQQATQTPVAKRNAIQKYLAMKLGASLAVTEAEVASALTAAEKVSVSQLRSAIGEFQSQLRTWGTIQPVYDTHPAPTTYVLSRGDHLQPRTAVGPGVLRVLSLSDATARIAATPADATTSGRRTALARWLTQPESQAAGLLARVVANRAWQHLFGRGIVETSDNFGIMGTPPDHPQLLDYLAVDFIESGWLHKRLLRQLVTSAAYQQSTTAVATQNAGSDQSATPHPASVDPDNRLLWRMELRQLESEVLRDTVLALSGRLDRSFGGAPVSTIPRADGFVRIDSSKLRQPADAYRRSLYLLQRRRYHESFLEAFGQPELTKNCTQRNATAVVGQSLTLINDQFMFEQSMGLTQRLLQETQDQPLDVTVQLAFQYVLSRMPDASEQRWASDLVQRQAERYQQQTDRPHPPRTQGLRHLCHMLLCTNEFLYTP